MAFLPSVKSIRQEDIGPEAPSWIGNLLGPLTIFMESVYSAFNKQITFQENISCNIREFVINTRNDYGSGGWDNLTFPSNLRRKPIGVLVLQVIESDGTVMTSSVFPSWVDLSGDIQIQYVSGLSANTKYTLRFLVV